VGGIPLAEDAGDLALPLLEHRADQRGDPAVGFLRGAAAGVGGGLAADDRAGEIQAAREAAAAAVRPGQEIADLPHPRVDRDVEHLGGHAEQQAGGEGQCAQGEHGGEDGFHATLLER